MSAQAHSEKIKLQRIDLRTSGKVKDVLNLAAELCGLSMSRFLIEAAYEKAKNLINAHETIKLSQAERDNFLLLLEKKPKANTQLKTAMKKYLSQNNK